MKVLIDGDSCNTIKKIIKEAKAKNVDVHIYCDTKRIIENDYATVHIIDSGPDAVDFAIIKATDKSDIVYTNDGGLASLVMVKGGRPIRFDGHRYSEKDISESLTMRYVRNRSYKHSHSKNLSSKHGKKKYKTIYITECWA